MTGGKRGRVGKQTRIEDKVASRPRPDEPSSPAARREFSGSQVVGGAQAVGDACGDAVRSWGQCRGNQTPEQGTLPAGSAGPPHVQTGTR